MSNLFSHARKFVIVHKSENEFENGQRFVVIGFLVFGQERSLDWISFHLPQVRFEIHIGHLLIYHIIMHYHFTIIVTLPWKMHNNQYHEAVYAFPSYEPHFQ